MTNKTKGVSYSAVKAKAFSNPEVLAAYKGRSAKKNYGVF